MLFHSYEFLFLFLPLTLLGFALLRQLAGRQGTAALAWLLAASLFFYGWWEPRYLLLIGISILVNFTTGKALAVWRRRRGVKLLLAAGIAFNLGLLAYYKYAGFLAGIVSDVAAVDLHLGTIILPLAISFFTFQQVAYLVDSWRGTVVAHDFPSYALFVTFFPQLIAGPIVLEKEILPQLRQAVGGGLRQTNLAIGITIFAIGLFKKTVIADSLAEFADPVFAAAADGLAISTLAAWGGALAYSFQLYFDFSGYSDMAIGLARLFGVRLPLNFHSPYKAESIIDFWRRWHMTLSRFLRDYLYIPLGGNRNGQARQMANVMIVMILGGLWHGAGWTFVIWGTLHGVYLVINHGLRRLPFWRRLTGKDVPGETTDGNLRLDQKYGAGLARWPAQNGGGGARKMRIVCVFMTFLAVTIAFVFFRAADLASAVTLLASMGGLGETGWDQGSFSLLTGKEAALGAWLVVAAAIVFLLPNTQQWMARYRPALGKVHLPTGWQRSLVWRPNVAFALITGLLLVAGIFAHWTLTAPPEFVYFQF